MIRDGNQRPGLRTWPVKACCRVGLGLHLVSLQNCGPRGTGSKRDGSKAGRIESGMGLTRGILKTHNPKSPFLLSPITLRERERERERERKRERERERENDSCDFSPIKYKEFWR